MRKMKRVVIIRAVVEAELNKISRRIQTLSENAYKLRQTLEQIDSLVKQEPYVKPKDGEAIDDAVRTSEAAIEETPDAIS